MSRPCGQQTLHIWSVCSSLRLTVELSSASGDKRRWSHELRTEKLTTRYTKGLTTFSFSGLYLAARVNAVSPCESRRPTSALMMTSWSTTLAEIWDSRQARWRAEHCSSSNWLTLLRSQQHVITITLMAWYSAVVVVWYEITIASTSLSAGVYFVAPWTGPAPRIYELLRH